MFAILRGLEARMKDSDEATNGITSVGMEWNRLADYARSSSGTNTSSARRERREKQKKRKVYLSNKKRNGNDTEYQTVQWDADLCWLDASRACIYPRFPQLKG